MFNALSDSLAEGKLTPENWRHKRQERYHNSCPHNTSNYNRRFEFRKRVIWCDSKNQIKYSCQDDIKADIFGWGDDKGADEKHDAKEYLKSY